MASHSKFLSPVALVPLLAFALPLLAAGGPPPGCGAGMGAGRGAGVAAYLATLPMKSVDSKEKAGLAWVREEEKLARDVYAELGRTWNVRVFSNIGAAEQQHMDEVKLLLDRYSLPDPVGQNPAGVFADARLKTLYDRLVAKGKASLVDALKVGAEIEDLDLSDLERERAATDNQDIGAIYQNLARGSRNHLRAFVRNLEVSNASYTPTHITQAEFDVIVAGSNERGLCAASGRPVGAGAACNGNGTRNGPNRCTGTCDGSGRPAGRAGICDGSGRGRP